MFLKRWNGPNPYVKEGGLQQKIGVNVVLQSFTGHTGPILYLAAHNMVVTAKEHRVDKYWYQAICIVLFVCGIWRVEVCFH